MAAYLACASRKLDKPLAVAIQSTSAAGKSTLMDGTSAQWLARLAPGRSRGVSPRGTKARGPPMTGQSLYRGWRVSRQAVCGASRPAAARPKNRP